MAERRQEFGKRGINPPPVITHAPQGLPGGPEPHSHRRLRTLAIALGAIGATAIGLAAGVESGERARSCPPPEEVKPEDPPCPSATSSSHGGSGRGFHGSWSSGGSGESGHAGASFGGFGGAGSAHGGFGGGGE
ncbi:MAG TPA: hypothetical protein VEH76_08445 [Methylocystis sp.]|nr:hypothetical protein [Methylocystis sp.]